LKPTERSSSRLLLQLMMLTEWTAYNNGVIQWCASAA